MSMSKKTQGLGGKLAANRRHYPERDHSALETELATSKLEDRIIEIVASAPPLTPAQRKHLSALLRRPHA